VSGFDQLSIQLNALGVSSVKQANLFYRKLGFELFRAVILKTPVDTGRARGGWDVQFGGPSSFVPPPIPRRLSVKGAKRGARQSFERIVQAAPLAGVKAATDLAEIGKNMHLTNNVEYIEVLEGGRRMVSFQRRSLQGPSRRMAGSIQAKDGMVRVSVAEIVAHYSRGRA
jgi:hypothetical protein